MPTLTFKMPDGSDQSASVDASFANLSPTAQHDAVDHMQADAVAKASSYAADGMSGAASVESGARATAGVIGQQLPDGFPGKQTLSDFGSAAPAIAQPRGYSSATSRLATALGNGDASGALSALPHAVVQGVPQLLGAIGAGALGAVGGPIGSAAAIAAETGATTFGDNVRARQAANGNAEPSTGDLVGGGLTSVAQAGLGVAGLKPGMLPGMAGRLATGSALTRIPAEIAAEGVAGAGNSLVSQTGQTLGTTKGLTIDPAEVAAAGLQAAGSRGITKGTEVAGDVAGGLAKKAAGLSYDAPTPEVAASIARTVSLVDERQAQIKRATGKDVSFDEAANSSRDELAQKITSIGRELRDSGAIDSDTYRTVLQPVIEQAQRHNKELGSSVDGETQTAFSRLQDLNIDPTIKSALVDSSLDLSHLAEASRKNRGSGPLEKLMGLAGQGVSLGGAIFSGNPVAMAGAVMGHGIAGKLGSSIGSGLDSMLGLRAPSIVARSDAANKVLNGADPGQNPLTRTGDIISQLRDPQNSLAASLKDTSGQADATGFTPSEQARGINLNETAGAWMERQMIARAKARQAAQQAQATGEAATAAQDTAGFQTQAGAAERLKQAQMDQMQAGRAQQQRQADAAYAANAPDYDAAHAQATAQAATQAAQQTAAEVKSGQAAMAAQTADRARLDKITASQEQGFQAKQDAQAAGEAATASQDMGMFQYQAKAAERLKQAQMDQMQTGHTARQNQTDAAYAGTSVDYDAAHAQAEQQVAAQRGEEVKSGLADMAQQNAERQRLAKIAAKSDAGTPDALAQSKLNKAAKGNEVDLRAANMSPGEANPSGPIANAAAMSDALRRSEMIGAKAGVDPATGNSPDPVPVNTPIGPSGVPMPALAQAAMARIQANAKTLQAPSGEPPAQQGALPTGAQNYVQRAVHMETGTRPSGHDVNAAIDDLVQTDKLDPKIGEAIKGGAFVDARSPEMQAIVAQTMQRVGQGHRVLNQGLIVDPNAPASSQPGAGNVPPPGTRAPIRDIARWQAARDDMVRHAADLASTAEARKDFPLADAIRNIGATPQASDKAKLRDDFLSTLSGQKSRLNQAKQILSSPALMKGV